MNDIYGEMINGSIYVQQAIEAYRKSMIPVEQKEEDRPDYRIQAINSLPDGCGTKVNLYV